MLQRWRCRMLSTSCPSSYQPLFARFGFTCHASAKSSSAPAASVLALSRYRFTLHAPIFLYPTICSSSSFLRPATVLAPPLTSATTAPAIRRFLLRLASIADHRAICVSSGSPSSFVVAHYSAAISASRAVASACSFDPFSSAYCRNTMRTCWQYTIVINTWLSMVNEPTEFSL